MHARQQIREAVVLALVPVPATVVSDRVWTVQQDELPLVGVYSSDEEISLDEGASFDAALRELTINMDIAVSAKTGDASMIKLDDLAASIETEMGIDRQLVGIMDVMPSSVSVEQSIEGDSVVSRMALTFTALYRTAIGFPENII